MNLRASSHLNYNIIFTGVESVQNVLITNINLAEALARAAEMVKTNQESKHNL